eukprot:TRINITY_DN22041_c0_g1_i1.p1 TRINITY_DN22041_c0_g1~~TRINITY_DN22041_c0_g1_i1.p1  ORF type:complete len:272 (-),score=85.77 TRINITY_DN22041_c0_g1_i1:51-836(-)
MAEAAPKKMTARERRRAAKRGQKAEEEDDGPTRPYAKKDFSLPARRPPERRPVPNIAPEEEGVLHEAQQVEDDSDNDPAYVPTHVRKQLNLPLAPKLPPALQETVNATGYKKGRARIKQAVNKVRAQEAEEAVRPKPPPIGSVQLDEQMLRKVFQKMDLDHNETVTSKILRHFFHQMGEMVSSEEINAMVAMVDLKDSGAVAYEDFAAIFSNPAEALRQVNVEAVKAAMEGRQRGEAAQEDEDESEESPSGEDTGDGSSDD